MRFQSLINISPHVPITEPAMRLWMGGRLFLKHVHSDELLWFGQMGSGAPGCDTPILTEHPNEIMLQAPTSAPWRPSGYVQRHLCELHTLYSNTLTAKTEYHLLVTKRIEEQMTAQRLHITHTDMCLERRQWYEQAKHDTVTWYAGAKTSLQTYKIYERMCTDTDKLLAHHLRQAHYMWRQQEHIMNLTQGFNDHCNQKTTGVQSPLQSENNTISGRIQTTTTDNTSHTETTTGTMGPHLVGSPIATPTKTTQSALGSKQVRNPAHMTTSTSTGKNGGPATS